MKEFTPKPANPLSQFMRQPKIYIRLPSEGQYWPEGSINVSENGEYPVYSMTAKDELMLKVPDAVMSGQAVVDVIQNCVPNIKNAWHVPSLDLDVILIAIRLATYGESMKTPINLLDDVELEYVVDLRVVMDNLQNAIAWEPAVAVNEDLTVFVRPLNYKQMSEAALKTFETQKLMQVISNNELAEDDKVKAFKESFTKLSDITLGVVKNSIYRIDSSAGSTSDPIHIKEFVENIDKELFNIIQKHLDALRDNNSIKPIKIPTPVEYKDKGIEQETIEIPLVFDPATFFV